MPTYFIIDGVKIELYYKDHNPPHFHAIISEYDALIDINTQKIIEGSLPKSKEKRIKKWAYEHKEILKPFGIV